MRRLNLTSLITVLLSHILIQSAISQTSNTMIVDWGDDTFSQLQVSFVENNITDISVGYEHTLAIMDNTTVVGWGDNSYQQLDIPSGIVDPIKVSSGLGHSLVLQNDKTVKAWGFNDFGQTEVSTLTNVIDIAAGDEHSLVLFSNGTVSVIANASTNYDLTPPPGLNNVVAIAAGNFHNIALINDGTVVAWGANEFGQTNVPVTLTNVTAVDAGQFHSIALLNDGSIIGWGDNTLFGQTNVPFDLNTATEINAGDYHNLALKNNGELSLWGSNRFTETMIPPVLSGRTIEHISAGFAHNTLVVSNQSPTVIDIPDTVYVLEDTPIDTDLRELATLDPDQVDSHYYELTSGEGDNDNASFNLISNNTKKVISDDLLWGNLIEFDAFRNSIEFNYEEDSIYTVRIKATDLGGLSVEKIVVIKIINVNEDVLSLDLSNDTVAENEPIGTPIGKFNTADTDLYDTHTYTLVAGTGGDDNAFFYISGDSLYTNDVFIADVKNTYFIRVRSTDQGGLYVEEHFAIKIIDSNTAPTDILLSNDTIADDLAFGSLVGFFETIDPDPEDSHTYTLVNGAGDTDNTAFTITSNSLLTNTAFDVSIQNTYSIRVQSTDDGKPTNLSFEKIFIITIIQSNELPVIVPDQIFEIREDAPNSTLVGTILAEDDGSLTFELLSGNTDDVFSLNTSTGELSVNDAIQLDAIDRPSYSLNIRVTDDFGEIDEKPVIVNVIFVPAYPEVETQTFSIFENDPNGTLVGQFVAVSPKSYPLQFLILSGNTDGAFSMSTDGIITVQDNANFDARRTPIYTLEIEVTDGKQMLSSTADAVIQIVDVNYAPTDIHLDNNTINELQPIGTRIGIFNTIDQDLGDIHTYALVEGDGGEDNNSFSISDDFLLSDEIFDAQLKDHYSVRVRSTDNGDPNQFVEKVFPISILALALPEIPTAITPNGDGINDVWEIPNLDLYPSNIVEIYDKSGQSVFYSQGYRSPWNGNFQGQNLPVASYYFIIRLNNTANLEYTGAVTILR